MLGSVELTFEQDVGSTVFVVTQVREVAFFVARIKTRIKTWRVKKCQRPKKK